MKPLAEARGEFMRGYLREVMDDAGGIVATAAQIAQVNRTAFYKMLLKYADDVPTRTELRRKSEGNDAWRAIGN